MAISAACRRLLLLVTAVSVLTSAQITEGEEALTGKKDPAAGGGGELGGCAAAMTRVYHAAVMAPRPPPLTGEWTSTGCEIRPGPEFLLRKYRFLESDGGSGSGGGDQFELHQFYYSDSYCRSPSYSIVARGRLDLETPSWLVPGAVEAAYFLRHVAVVPHTHHMASLIQSKVNRTCPKLDAGVQWRAGQRYELLNYVEYDTNPDDSREGYVAVDEDCTSALHLAFHELQLVRVEVRRPPTAADGQGGSSLQPDKLLYLGDVHPELGQRATYRPTSYQEPLVLRTHTTPASGCPVCRLLTGPDPPRLHHHRHFHLRTHMPAGEWFSTRCEARPLGTFLTRHLLFTDSTWEGDFHHFSDELCRQPLYSVYASGNYSLGEHSPSIEGAVNYDLVTSSVHVTPRDERILRLVTSAATAGRCGPVGGWAMAHETDLTHSAGCWVLRVPQVPTVEHSVLRLEHHMLYLGATNTHGTDARPDTRPTAFQAPLTKCGDHTAAAPPLGLRRGNVGVTVIVRDPVAAASRHVATSIGGLIFTALVVLILE